MFTQECGTPVRSPTPQRAASYGRCVWACGRFGVCRRQSCAHEADGPPPPLTDILPTERRVQQLAPANRVHRAVRKIRAVGTRRVHVGKAQLCCDAVAHILAGAPGEGGGERLRERVRSIPPATGGCCSTTRGSQQGRSQLELPVRQGTAAAVVRPTTTRLLVHGPLWTDASAPSPPSRKSHHRLALLAPPNGIIVARWCFCLPAVGGSVDHCHFCAAGR